MSSTVSLSVPENSLATPIGIPPPTVTGYPASALGITILTLPSNGVVVLADGITAIAIGETLTVAQLTGLAFNPSPGTYGQSSALSYSVTTPAGSGGAGSATLTIGPDLTPLVVTSPSVLVAQNGGATPIGIAGPSDAGYAATALTVKVTGLPTNGTVILADGVTHVAVGQILTVEQLTGLQFAPATGVAGRASSFLYAVSDPSGNSANGHALLQVNADTPPVAGSTSLQVAAGSGVIALGIAAPIDASYPASTLSVTVSALPSDGTVFLADGLTSVTAGELLTVAQLTSLMFQPSPSASSKSSTFSYHVTDPGGGSGSGSVVLSVGAQGTPLLTSPAILTVVENSSATPIGIAAPSDSAYAASALTVNITGLPTDGRVLLADGMTPIAVNQTISVAQLTSLTFLASQGNTGSSSTLVYTVSDPAGQSATGSAMLVTGPNAIVLENEKQGTPESVWQLPNGVDSTNIQGFTTQISTDVGQTVSFKINTSSAHYRIDIYRLGYYGGNGARLVNSIDENLPAAQIQPTALVNPTTGEVDAGNWNASASWTVPADAVSGVYVADLVREDGTAGMSQVPFVIRNDYSRSDVAFQTNDETWQAYNGWGGTNLYGGNGPGVNGAAYAVSYNRPIITGDPNGGYEAGPQDTVMGVEYSTIQWLEKNGYDVSYLSGTDVSSNGALLLNHKVYMDAGHDEYWTGSQRANVQAAADAGVSLAFLSGNEMYWKTQLGPSIDGTSTSNRTLVTYKDTHYNALINPTGVWTGAWEDPRFAAALSSNSLTGTLFHVDSYQQGTITIPYADTQLRVWRNTSVAATKSGQTASLTPGLLGYEWDSSPDNGFRPGGLIDLSSTTVPVSTALLDYGNTTGNATATHNLVEYRDPVSGALVFGAGTVFWSWGLSDDHQFGQSSYVPPDANVQQATVNFLADMGVQPSTLQSTLVLATKSTDHTPPTSVVAALSSASIVEGQQITVTGTASDVSGKVAGVEVSSDGGVTWHPATGTTNWTFTFTTAAPGNYSIETRATDDSLNTEVPGAGTPYTVTSSSALSLFSPTDTPAILSVNDPGSVELGVKFVAASNGQITGLRFYKSPTDIGTHTAHLWSTTGTLLASATFINETASGWQQVNLLTPVKVTAGNGYVVSYHNAGTSYVSTNYYFDSQGIKTGSLSASGNGLNGFYSYGVGPVFPTTASATNYYADVVFKDTSQGPQANDDNAVTVTENGSVTIPVATLLASDTDPSGYAVSVTGVSNPTEGIATFDPVAQTITFVPTAGYTGAAGFVYSISDGHGGTASGNVGVTVDDPVTAQSLFFTSDVPGTLTANDSSAVELGVKFEATVTGAITGLRFYKGPSNTGPHIADLWSNTGALLATAAYTSETASGWQQVNFTSPVPITAGTVYVASYHTDGNYSVDSNYFVTPHSNEELTALASASGGGNGVFSYSNNSIFPTSSFNATNYWVDVVFSGTPLAVVANPDTFAGTEGGTLVLTTASLLANDTDPYGYALSVTSVGGASNGAVAYDSASQTISFTPTAGYTGAASFTYTVDDGHGSTASGNVALSINPPEPIAINDSGFVAIENTALTIPVATLLANDTDPFGYALSLTSVGNPADGTVTYDANAQTVTFVPTSGYTGPAKFTYTIGDGHGGTASGNVGLVVDYPVSAQSLFFTSDMPGTVTVADNTPVELGVKFQVSVNGAVTGIRFYKGLSNTGPHVGDLWSSTGILLATAAFTGETASGWQQVNFSNPVSVTAGASYVASYHTNGDYSADASYFTGAHTHEDLTAPDSASAAGNGVYAYGGSTIFPSHTYNAANYWVDLVFSASTLPPVANNDSATGTENSMLTLTAAALLANDTDPYGYALSIADVSAASHGTVAYNAGSQTISFVPDAGYAGTAGFAYSISDGHGGTASANVAVSVNPAANPAAANDGGLIAIENTALSIPASQLLANDTDPGGFGLALTGVSSPSNGTVTFDPVAQTITFVPTSGYTGPASFTYSIMDGHGGAASGNAVLAIEPPSTTTLFSASATPAVIDTHDSNPIEVGVKFQAATNGVIDGLLFYKGPANVGPHVADLWSNTGSLLATAPFTNETSSGWQLVSFASPVQILAGTTYVASYHTSGDYSATSGYFASADTNGPLTALANATGGDGVFTYGSNSVFPVSSYNATNYWVDVLFTPGSASNPLVAVPDTGTTNQNTTLAVGAVAGVLANDTDTNPGATTSVAVVNGLAANVGNQVKLASGALLTVNADGSYSYNPNGKFNGLQVGQSATDSFTYTVADSQGASSSTSDTITITGLNDPPVAVADTGTTNQNATLTVAAAAGVLANDTDPDAGDTKTVAAVNGAAGNVGSQITLASGALLTVNADGSYSYNPNGKFRTLQVGQSATDGFTYTVADSQGATSSTSDTITIAGQAPPAIGFTLSGSFFTSFDSVGSLQSNVNLGSFKQVGGTTGDTYKYSLASGSALQFTVSATGALTTNTAVAGSTAGTVYVLNVNVQDSTLNASTTKAYDVVVGNDSGNTIVLPNGTPTIALGLQGSDTLNGSGSTVPLWLIAGGSRLNEGSGKFSFLAGGASNDVLIGGSGADSLTGGGGADTLTGGAGADRFIYNAASDSTLAGPDTITDFTHATDLIDFTNIAGINATPVAFQGQITGQINAHDFGWTKSGSDTDIFVNTTGGSEGVATAQMEIILKGVTGSKLTAIDFHHA